MMQRDYTLLLSVAMEQHCPDHKVRVEKTFDGMTLVHGDHRRQVSMLAIESESALIEALYDFVKTCHDYDEDEDER